MIDTQQLVYHPEQSVYPETPRPSEQQFEARQPVIDTYQIPAGKPSTAELAAMAKDAAMSSLGYHDPKPEAAVNPTARSAEQLARLPTMQQMGTNIVELRRRTESLGTQAGA